MEEYENELKKLKNEITLAKEKVASGQLSELRDSVSRMNDIRVEGHKKFR
ncbi:cytochrome B562 [Salmonella enterica]|nr:cytochrome B562 [Salmonella enterica]